jgi:hypothetical protein
MTDDPKDEDDGTVDAAQAFEALRAEVAGLRQVVEALPAAWEACRPPDTTPTLGGIVQGLTGVTARLEAIERHPALRLTPEQHRQALAQASGGLLRDAARELERAAQGVAHERRQLSQLVGSARQRQEQRAWLATTGLAAVVAGLLLSPLVASALPFGLNGQVAALILREDRWHAGAALMRAASPETWSELAAATQLARANDAKLGSCRAAASKAGKDQRCTITVPAP